MQVSNRLEKSMLKMYLYQKGDLVERKHGSYGIGMIVQIERGHKEWVYGVYHFSISFVTDEYESELIKFGTDVQSLTTEV